MRSSLRILFVTHNIPRFAGDAAGSFVLRLAVALQAQGATVKVIAPGTGSSDSKRSNASDNEDDEIEGVRISRVPYGSRKQMTLAYEGNMAEVVRASMSGKLALVKLIWCMRRAVLKEIERAEHAGQPYDVVHAHWWFPSALALWRTPVFSSSRPPLAITMHGSDVRLAIAKQAAHPIMRSVLQQATVCTAVSTWLSEQAQIVAPSVKIETSPMPVDVRLFPNKLQNPDATPTRKGVLFVGRLNAQKGLKDLLEAMTNPALTETPLVVVGDGPDRDALKNRAIELGVNNRITWTGALPQSQLEPLYSAASAVAIPSHMEGLGLVAVEAQLSGAPVVAYNEGGLRDVVDSTTGGTLVAPGDTKLLGEALASTISFAQSNPLEAAQLAAQARSAMLKRFSPEAVAAKYMGYYEKALASGSKHG